MSPASRVVCTQISHGISLFGLIANVVALNSNEAQANVQYIDISINLLIQEDGLSNVFHSTGIWNPRSLPKQAELALPSFLFGYIRAAKQKRDSHRPASLGISNIQETNHSRITRSNRIVESYIAKFQRLGDG